MWWHLSFETELMPSTSVFKELAKELSKEQIANAKKMADDWKKITGTNSNSLKDKKAHE